MTLKIPKPIEIYFQSENAHDAEALDRCLAPDAVVRDEGRTMTGVAAIKAWRLAAAVKYAHRSEPTNRAERDGKIVVTAKVSGNFPGSPIALDHIFEIDGDKIISLEIG